MTSREQGAETRERILQVAEERFAHSGYDASGVAEICQAAQVTKGAFYHHFSSKQELFMELLQRWLATLDSQMLAVSSSAVDVPQRLLAMADVAQEAVRAEGDKLFLFLEFWTRATRDPEVWEAVTAPYQRYIDFLADIVHQGIEEGSIRNIDADMVARALISLASGLFLQVILTPGSADWQDITRRAFEMFLNGIRKEKDRI